MKIKSDKCQLCLADNEMFLPIFSNSEIGGPSLSTKITICLSLPIENNNSCSNKICELCEEKITQFYEFRENCLKAYYSSLQNYHHLKNRDNFYVTDNPVKTEITQKEEALDLPEETNQIVLPYPAGKGNSEPPINTNPKDNSATKEGPNELPNILHNSVNDHMTFIKSEPQSFHEYKCLHCNNLFADLDTATIHCTECSNINQGKEYSDGNSTPHSKEMSGGSNQNYDQRDKNIVSNYKKSESREIKSKKEHLQCSECNNMFSNKSALKRHMFIHTGERPFNCEICDKKFSQLGQLNFHRKLHFNPRYRCEVCNKPFLRPSDMEKHVRIHTGEKPFTCKICDKSFTQSIALKQHERIHTGHKPYGCEICGKTFTQNANRTKHLKIHKEGMKPHTCDICGRSFSEYREMILHRDGHGGGKPRICNYCDQRFRKRSELSDHIRRYHTLERPHKCAFCSKSFFALRALKQHVMSHTGHKPFSCGECQQKFTQKGNLKKHVERKHKGREDEADKNYQRSVASTRLDAGWK